MPETKPRGPSVLIVAPPGRLRDALQVMVRAVPQIGYTVQTDDAPAVLSAAEHYPALVLLDTDLPGHEAWTVLQQIKARWPQTRCIVLVNNGQQSQIANAHGADAVLVKGFMGVTLKETVAKLLYEEVGGEM